MNKNSSLYIYILGGLLIVSLFFVYINNRKNKQIQQFLKDEFSTQLSELNERYDDVSSENEDLNERLIFAKDSISKLRKDLRKLDLTVYELRKLKKKVKEMQKQQRGLIKLADSLRVENRILTAQRDNAESALKIQTKLSEKLSDKNKELSTSVDKASLLEILDVKTEGVKISSSGKVSVNKRARRIDKIRSCFTIAKNKIAKKGNRDFYVRVLSPNNKLITELKTGNSFTAEDRLMKYSGNIDVLYENQNLEVCVYVGNNDKFEKGIYRIFIYTESRLLKETELLLK